MANARQDEVLMMHASTELDAIVDVMATGTSHRWPSRDWSRDLEAIHALYDPIAKRLRWQIGFNVVAGANRGWLVRDQEGELLGKATTCGMAMLRAWMFFRFVEDGDRCLKPMNDEIWKKRAIRHGTTVTSTANGQASQEAS